MGNMVNCADGDAMRAERQKVLEMFDFWMAETGDGVIVFVGFGSRWFTFGCDAELLVELGLGQQGQDIAVGDHPAVPVVDLQPAWTGETEPSWLAELSDYETRFVLLRTENGKTIRSEETKS